MSIKSARRQMEGLDTASGYCFPLSLDSAMKGAELPPEYYGMFREAHKLQSSEAFNKAITTVITGFFGFTPTPANGSSHVAMYSAYGSSAQPYFPDVAYEYDLTNYEGTGIQSKQLRLGELLQKAGSLGCNVLFSSPSQTGSHVAALELIDNDPISYLVRDSADSLRPNSYHIYQLHELWMHRDIDGVHHDKYAPLPEFERSFYPAGTSSWELFILPPEPR